MRLPGAASTHAELVGSRPAIALRLALIAVAALLWTPAAAGAAETVPYSVDVDDGSRSDARRFRAVVDATLNDPRGWSLGGSVAFRRRASGDFRVLLAPPAVVATYGGCSAYYSCRSGSTVLVNEERWRLATDTYPGRRLRHAYRQMVINHEVGHALGFGHAACAAPGAPAPVMLQQSKSLGGCARNAWPAASERAAYAERLGVGVRRAARVRPGRSAGGVRLGMRAGGVRPLLGAPDRVRPAPAGGRLASYAHARVTLHLEDGRVAAVTTRSRHDRTRARLGPGTREEALRMRLPGLRCGVAVAGRRTCLAGPAAARGDRPTSFRLARGRVTAVTVERLGASVPPFRAG